MGRVLDRCHDVFTLQGGKVGQNLIERYARADEIKNVADPDAHSANARASAALSLFDGYSLEAVCIHIVLLPVRIGPPQNGANLFLL
jgi:hypothetical protein